MDADVEHGATEMAEYELGLDGLLRKRGRIVEMPPTLQAPADLYALISRDADQEAARRYMRTAQTPVQTYVTGQQL